MADPPRLSCGNASFPRLERRDALALIRALGFGHADVCVFDGLPHVSLSEVQRDPGAAADAVRSDLERAELGVADVFATLSSDLERLTINHPSEAVRREAFACFESLVGFAERLGSPGLTLLPGMPFPGVDDRAGRELAAAELERRAALAGERGLALSFEPHFLSIVATPADVLELLSQAPSVGVTLDCAHFVYQGLPWAEAVAALAPHARHLHLRDAAAGTMQARLGEGSIDFAGLLEALGEAGYDGYLAVEYVHEEWLDCDRVDCVSEAADLRALLLAR